MPEFKVGDWVTCETLRDNGIKGAKILAIDLWHGEYGAVEGVYANVSKYTVPIEELEPFEEPTCQT